MNTITKTIHLISATREPPPRYADCISKMRDLHPDWRLRIWDDVAAACLVKQYFPEWLRCYHAYKLPVQRTDIFRAMVVYLYGGFYLDMDIFCLRSLDDLCGHGLVLGIEKILSHEECLKLHHQYPVRMANYMFGSIPGHGFWMDFLMAAKAKAGTVIREEEDVLETTGPGLLTNVYHEAAARYKNIVVLRNMERDCPVACGPASCHFGDYAMHLHFGSWRWQTVAAFNCHTN
jgi:inositol phosphorylceramide mannosyltransferase catalytic subunit